MRHLLPALALASAVSLFAAVPMASAQNGGMPPYGAGYGMASGMGPMMGSGMGSGMDAATMAALAAAMAGQSSSSTNGSGQTQYTCAIGQVMPFNVPVNGIDSTGRPYFFQTNGWYGPYDGFGYPVVTQMIGQYGGVPMQRTSQGYIPSPCPVSSTAGGLGSGYGSMGYGSMGSMSMGYPSMSSMGPMMAPPANGMMSLPPGALGPMSAPMAPSLGGLVGPMGY
jgi:hypothetical protein